MSMDDKQANEALAKTWAADIAKILEGLCNGLATGHTQPWRYGPEAGMPSVDIDFTYTIKVGDAQAQAQVQGTWGISA